MNANPHRRSMAARAALGVTVAALLTLGGSGVAEGQPFASGDAGPIFCSVASDCGNPYLTCAPAQVFVCRDADAASVEPGIADAAICPATSPETVNWCEPTYQLPCKTSADCGPAGFTCNPNAGTDCSSAGCVPIARCESQYTLCSSDSDCPIGWSCYAPAALPPPPGGDSSTSGWPTACYPPFAMFNGSEGPAALNGPAGGLDGASEGGSNETVDAGSASDLSGTATGHASSGGCALASGAGPFEGAWLFALGIVAGLRRRSSRFGASS
jgi:hypothetical protein